VIVGPTKKQNNLTLSQSDCEKKPKCPITTMAMFVLCKNQWLMVVCSVSLLVHNLSCVQYNRKLNHICGYARTPCKSLEAMTKNPCMDRY